MRPKPIAVGARLRIVPPGIATSAEGRIDLVLRRGAFGSGEHETTVACLELLETLDELGDARVLDVGSGTGVLAIAALRLGARSATCVDPEAGAVACARDNGILNGLDDRLEHVCGELSGVLARDYDVVLANLYGHVLVQIAAELVERTRPGGTLVLSGMLWEQDFEVRQRFRGLGCSERTHRTLEEFTALVLQAPGESPSPGGRGAVR